MKKPTKKPIKKTKKKRKISKRKVLEYTVFGLKLYKTIKRGL